MSTRTSDSHELGVMLLGVPFDNVTRAMMATRRADRWQAGERTACRRRWCLAVLAMRRGEPDTFRSRCRIRLTSKRWASRRGCESQQAISAK